MRQLLIFAISFVAAISVYGQNCQPKPSCLPKPQNCEKPKVTYTWEEKTTPKKKNIKKFSFLLGPSILFSPEPRGGLISGKVAASSETKNYFNPENISGLMNGFMGIRLDQKRIYSIGFWGTTGLRSNENTSRLISRQQMAEGIQNGVNIFGEIEAGILWADRFRLSAGIGSQQFRNQADSPQNAHYFTSSAGFLLPIGKNLFWNTSATLSYGRDFQKLSIRPSTGILLNLNTIE